MTQANLVGAAPQLRLPLLRCQVDPGIVLFNSLDEHHLSLTLVTVGVPGDNTVVPVHECAVLPRFHGMEWYRQDHKSWQVYS